jgi:hypothetical protein
VAGDEKAHPAADLAQKPIRSQSAVMRDHYGRPRSEFVRSRNPVTVIIKIESRDLDRRPEFGLPQAMSGNGRISRLQTRSIVAVAQAARRS